MTARALIRSILDKFDDLDDEINVEIIRRDSHNFLVATRKIPITLVSGTRKTLMVEQSDIDKEPERFGVNLFSQAASP